MDSDNPFAYENGGGKGGMLELSNEETTMGAHLMFNNMQLVNTFRERIRAVVKEKKMDSMRLCMYLSEAIHNKILSDLLGGNTSVNPLKIKQFMRKCNTEELAEKLFLKPMGINPWEGIDTKDFGKGTVKDVQAQPKPPSEYDDPPDDEDDGGEGTPPWEKDTP